MWVIDTEAAGGAEEAEMLEEAVSTVMVPSRTAPTSIVYVPSGSVVRPRWKLPSSFRPVPVPICVVVPSASRTCNMMES